MADGTSAPQVEPRGELHRVLGPVSATCVVVGAIVGVGIFFNPGQVARAAGSANLALLAWTIGGLIALAGALSFAQLGVAYPSAGGQYELLCDAYGRAPAFLYVFCNGTAIQPGAIAIIALVCASNIGVLTSGQPLSTVPALIVSAILIGALMLTNIVGVRWGAAVQNFTVFAKLAALAAIVLIAATAQAGASTATASSAPAPAVQSATGFALVTALLASVMPSFFAYGGWQHALWMAGEVRSPRRVLPIAIIGGVLLVVVVYVSANWAYLHMLGFGGVTTSKALAADAVGAAWGEMGRRLTAAAVMISAFGVLNAQLLSGPRLIYRMAQDSRQLRALARVSGFGTPIGAILVLGILALVLLFSLRDRADDLVSAVVMIDGVFFALTGLAAFLLRRTHPERFAGAAALGYPIAPALFVLGEITLLSASVYSDGSRTASLIAGGWLVAAGVCYLLLFRRQTAALNSRA